jgi:putative NADPH-quinone reductase
MNHSSPPALETDLVMAQEAIKWAEHLVFVYPIWWGTIPALLKGFIERVFLPGFAVNFRDNSPLWDKLLTGRSAHLIVTLNTPSWIYRWIYGRPGHNTMKKTILEFCGIKPVRITEVGPVRNSTDAKRKQWLAHARALGVDQA